mgnify:CR=1 FL=1
MQSNSITCGTTAKLFKNLWVSDMIEAAMTGIVENIQTPNQTLAMK